MRIMEYKSEKNEKIEDIQSEQNDANRVLKRPKSFSLRRRSEAFYFSGDSENGILKRVPIKYGSYKYNEIKTVVQEPDFEKNRNEIWSDVPLNSPGDSKSDKNRTAASTEDSYKAIHSDKRNDNVLKAPEETNTGIKLLSKDFKNLTLIKDYKEDLKPKDGKKQLRVSNQGRKRVSFHKSFQRPQKKNFKTHFSIPTHCEKSINSYEKKYGKFSASNASSSSSKMSEPEDEPLNTDELSKMQMKTTVTEL